MRKPTIIISSLLVVLIGFFLYDSDDFEHLPTRKLDRLERQKLRTEYFFNKLKDPITNKMPENVRYKELQFKKKMNAGNSNQRTSSVLNYEWNEVGPADVGGRTRALVLDSRNSDVILAGGVSGGIWKSTDGGTTWTAKLPSGSYLGITSIAQDPNSPDTWFATTGEIQDGGSTSGKGQGYNPFLGAGIYKSTDNGETWTLSSYAYSSQNTVVAQAQFEDRITKALTNPFILTNKILAHDFNGSTAIFVTTQYSGIWASVDGGNSFEKFASDAISGEDPTYCDIVVDENDYITVWFGPTDSGNNGLFRSWDEGDNFFNVSGENYPIASDGARAVLAVAPSNPSLVYSFLYDGSEHDGGSHFFKYDFTNADGGGTSYSAFDRSENLPEFDRSIFGGTEGFSTQGGYDMTVAVHPTDENFVVLGYVNLVRSTDGFATAITGDPAFSWIGGNENPYLNDEGGDFEGVHHADQHIVLFDPKAPNTMLSGHDGGLSKTTNIKANRIAWTSLNNDYNITQYYTISAGMADGDSYIIGGTQDNGTPLLDHSSFVDDLVNSDQDLSSGDGSYCYAGNEIAYSSAQNGALVFNSLTSEVKYRFIEREDLQHLFIHPFTIDPNDEGTLFYSSNGDGILARNDGFDEAIAQVDLSPIENGWDDFNLGVNLQMTALKVTDQNPSHKLYFGGSVDGAPALASLDNANTAADLSGLEELDVSFVEDGAWLADIAVNPKNGEEIILVYSNYNITGLYYSNNGGSSFTAIEGNLGDNDDAPNHTGPSLRAAEIAEDSNGNKKYFVGTSIGLFSTTSLAGANTVWSIETPMLDNIVIEDLFLRSGDGALAVGTHGRGAFIATTESQEVNNAPQIANQSFNVAEDAVINTSIGQIVASDPDEDNLTFSISSGNANSVFNLEENTGELSLVASIDFETTSSYTLEVEISDGELTATAQITVNVQDVNEAPEVASNSADIDEDATIGTSVVTVSATDPENDNLTYSLSAGNTGSVFEISSTGEITVASELDFETTSSYSLVVEVSDGELTGSNTITINVNDIAEIIASADILALQVYPNPTTDYIHFGGKTIELVVISNLAGQSLMEKYHVESVNLSDLKNSIYLLTITDIDGKKYHQKIVKR